MVVEAKGAADIGLADGNSGYAGCETGVNAVRLSQKALSRVPRCGTATWNVPKIYGNGHGVIPLQVRC